MPLPPSTTLQEVAKEDLFSEVFEVVRQFTVWLKDETVRVDVTVSRYYTETGSHYHLSYTQSRESGEVFQHDYGQVHYGMEDEEKTIQTAISFIRQAHRIGY